MRCQFGTLVILSVLGVASCGGTITSSKKTSGTKTESTTTQPQEVAGGFGLTCSPAENPSDSTKTDFTCAFRDKNGVKFKERPDIKLNLVIKVGDSIIPVVFLPDDAASNFKFTVAKADQDKVQLGAQFVNPQGWQ